MDTHQTPCIFCDIISGKSPAVEVYRDAQCVVIMDIFPMSKGHVLVIPRAHHQYVDQLPEALQAHIFSIAIALSQAVIRSDLNAKASNFLINNGKAANQHVPHVHLHIIPRYKNDSLKMLFKMVFKPLFMIKPIRTDKLKRIAEQIKPHHKPEK